MMKLRLVGTVAIVTCVGFGFGCRQDSVELETVEDLQVQEEDVVDPQVILEALMDEVDALEGDVAIERLKALVADEEYEMLKQNISERLIDTILEERDLITAQDDYLELAAADEFIARVGYGKLLQASTTTNAVDVVQWYEKVLEAPVSDSMKAYTWTLLVRSNAGAESIMPLVSRLDEIVAFSQGRDSHSILGSIVKLGLSIEDYDGLKALSEGVSSTVPEREDLAMLMLKTKGDILLQQGKLAEVETFLIENVDMLNDGITQSIAVKLLKASLAKKDPDTAARLVASAYKNSDKNPNTRNGIARMWIQNSVDIQNSELFYNRINEAVLNGYPKANIVSVFRDGFYMVMASDNADVKGLCLALARDLSTSEELSESSRQAISLLLLDGAFYQNDFSAAYKLVEDGVPGYDDSWHTEMLDKVGAHLALQENRHEDAIELFRKHMGRVEKWTEPVTDPTNGAKMSREAVLGFNEKRIGDIYGGMEGRTEDSQAAYIRARDWYQKAIAECDKDSIEYRQFSKELEDVPLNF